MSLDHHERPAGRSPETPGCSSTGINKSKIPTRFAAIAASVAALTGLCIGSQGKNDGPNDGTTATTDASENLQGQSNTENRNSANVLDYSIMPRVEMSERRFEFPLPPEYRYSKEELAAAAGKLKDYVTGQITGMQQYLGTYGTADQEKEVNGMIENIYRYLEQDKILAAFASERRHPGEDDFQYHSRAIEKALVHIGQYFKAEKLPSSPGKATVLVNMQPITAAETVTMKDREGVYQVPVLVLGGGSSDKVTGIYDTDIGAATIRNGEIDRVLLEAQQQMREFNLLPSNFDPQRFREEYIRDTKIHEATHAYIGQKFPRMGNVTDAKARININLNMIVNDTTRFPIAGYFHPINLQELCGVGNELFNSKDDSRYSFMKYAHQTAGPGYELVNRVIVFYAIKRAPDSPQKRELEAQLAAKGAINTMEVVRLIKDTYTRKQVQEVGFKLYEIGFDLLIQAEKAAQ